MVRENKTQYVILGFLQYKPMSGYDIKKSTDESLRYFWQENYGHIYPVLAKLQEQGMVTSSLEASETGPDRKVYSITEKGKEAFTTWLNQEAEPPKYRKELLLKLFFLPADKKDSMVNHLEAEIERHKKLMIDYKKVQSQLEQLKTDSNYSPAWLFTVRNGMYTSEAQINWCRECIEFLTEKN